MAKIQNKPIGERIVFSKDKNRLLIEIDQKVAPWKETLLATWVVAVGFCAIMMAYSSLYEAETNSQKAILVVIFGLLTFLVLRVGKVWFWRRKGKEIIGMSNGRLTIKNAFGNRGRTEDLKAKEVKNLGLEKTNDRNYFQFMDNSFWSLGGERISFRYGGKSYALGKQLSEKDATVLLRVLQNGIRDFSKGHDDQ